MTLDIEREKESRKKGRKREKKIERMGKSRSRMKLRVRLFGIILANNYFFHPKKSVFVYLDKFLKINRISKKSVFSFFGEAEKSSF